MSERSKNWLMPTEQNLDKERTDRLNKRVERVFDFFQKNRNNPEKLINLFLKINHSREHFEEENREKIDQQKESLQTWIDGIREEFEEEYKNKPEYIYLATVFLQSTLFTEKGDFAKRGPNSFALFPQYLSGVFKDSAEEFFNSRKRENKELKLITPNEIETFRKIYSKKYNKHWEKLDKNIPEIPQNPQWLEFENCSEEELNKMMELSANTPAGWCTGNRGTAIDYTTNGGKRLVLVGDHEDKQLAYAVIRIRNNRIAEIRGRLMGQQMPQGAIDLVTEKLEELKNDGITGVKEYVQKLKGLDEFLIIEKLFADRQEDESFQPKDDKEIENKLKAIIDNPKNTNQVILKYVFGLKSPQGVGYGEVDQKVLKKVREVALRLWQEDDKIRSKSTNYINQYLGKSYQPDEIVLPGQELNEKIRVILGDYTFKEEDRKYLKNIEIIVGNVEFRHICNINFLSLRTIYGNANFENVFNLDFPSLTEIDGKVQLWRVENVRFSLLKKINRELNLQGGVGNVSFPSLIETNGHVWIEGGIGVRNINLASLIKVNGKLWLNNANNINLQSFTRAGVFTFVSNTENVIFKNPDINIIGEYSNSDDNETIKKKIDFKMQIVDLILLVNDLRFEGNDLTEQQKIIFNNLIGDNGLGVEYSEENQRKLEGLMKELKK